MKSLCIRSIIALSLFCGLGVHAEKDVLTGDPKDSASPAEWVEYGFSLESPHPYSNTSFSIPVKIEGAKKLKIFFSRISTEDGSDFVYVKDSAGRQGAKFTGNQTNITSQEVTGDSATIVLSVDSSVTDWGFQVSKIYVQY